jgi:hypothetical protein
VPLVVHVKSMRDCMVFEVGNEPCNVYGGHHSSG